MKKLILILSVVILTSCHKNENDINENDYLIFGHFFGECMGETCIETYKLTSSKLYENQNDNYAHTDFNFIELDNDKFNDVSDLSSFLPTELLNESDSTFGCPDCHDQGGLFISFFNDNELKTWRIDNDKNAVPSYLHDFMDKVNQKIELINN